MVPTICVPKKSAKYAGTVAKPPPYMLKITQKATTNSGLLPIVALAGALTPAFQRYDPVANSWTLLAPVPISVAAATLVYDKLRVVTTLLDTDVATLLTLEIPPEAAGDND